ncbi:MAG: RNA polymerase sigma factor [Chitinophagales bacterium]|nr:RNA polymerase sigma factor [Chitinophagaceae bacterium]MCB9065544.1 RNA polymerase sigma factor [Chitinophagales bacterium]
MATTDLSKIIATQTEYLKPFAISLTRNAEDANDLYQETMLRALVNKDKYKHGTNIKAWLYTIMRNIFINTYRRNKKFSKVTSDVPEDVLLYNVDKKAKNIGWSNVRLGEIKSSIEKLPEVFRTSFELYYMGYKYQEIASMLNEPLGTVKSRIHFARKILTSTVER